MKNKRKSLDYIAVSIFVLLLAGSLIFGFKIFNSSSDINKEITNEKKDDNLDKYRSEDIPEECRLPEYDYDIDWWKEHLSHHEETWHCLGYYE